MVVRICVPMPCYHRQSARAVCLLLTTYPGFGSDVISNPPPPPPLDTHIHKYILEVTLMQCHCFISHSYEVHLGKEFVKIMENIEGIHAEKQHIDAACHTCSCMCI